MQTIYYKSHKSRGREAAFFNFLYAQFPQAIVINKNFPIAPHYLDYFVDTNQLVASIQADQLLPKQKRQQCLEFLKTCPSLLRVASKPSQISFDIVIEQGDKLYYWEFHEEQHRRLTVDRIKKVFAPDGTAHEIPRYLQRLIRDVWRVQHFQSYTIIWSDWFAYNQMSYKPQLEEGFHEYYREGKFSFQAFCNTHGPEVVRPNRKKQHEPA